MKKLILSLILLTASFGVSANCFYVPVFVDNLPTSLAEVCQQKFAVGDKTLSTIKIHSLTNLHIKTIALDGFNLIDASGNKFYIMKDLTQATDITVTPKSIIHIKSF